jgi:acetyl-CoA carboxylase biotin carboxyl carrier protein
MALIFVLNGPNLNMLGKREPSIYGGLDLAGIERLLKERAAGLGHEIDFRQTNHEGDLVDWIHEADGAGAGGIVLNPGAYTHTSIALHDAIRSAAVRDLRARTEGIRARARGARLGCREVTSAGRGGRPNQKQGMTMSRTKSGIDPEIIRELAHLLTETDLTEIEVQQADLRIRVARQIQVTATVPMAAPVAQMAPAPYAGAAPGVAAAEAPTAESDLASHPGVLKSPMVGTAYLGPAPGAKPFVDIGQTVNQGDRVLIVEAMKTFNDIVAPRSGKVTALLIEDKQPVEYGQPLMIIE